MMKLNIQLFAGYDGTLIIGTELDTNDFEKKLKNLEKQFREISNEINRLTKKKIDLEAKLNFNDKELENKIKAIKEETKFNIETKYTNWGMITEEGRNYQKEQQLKINKLRDEYSLKNSQILDQEDQINSRLEEDAKLQEIIAGKAEEVKSQMMNTTKEAKEHSNVLGKVISKIGKWALAIVGIRSMYSAIRKAISLVSAQSESVANQIKVMQSAMANALLPVVQKIMNIIAQIMMLINYIYGRLTNGKMLFDFSKAFADANKNAKSTAGSVGKIAKTMAGFDEMNTLQDNSSAGAGGGGGISAIDNPFKDWQNFKPPKWLDDIINVFKWIIDYWPIVVGAITAIAGTLLVLLVLHKSLSGGGLAETVTSLGPAFSSLLESLGQAVVIIAILGGFALVLKEVANLLDVFAKSGLEVSDVLGLLGTVIGSVVILITAMTLATQLLQNPLAMAGLAVLTASICATLLLIAKTLPGILDALGKFITATGPTLNAILNTIGTQITNIIYALGTVLPPIINSVGNLFDKIFGGISKVVSTVGNTIIRILNTAKGLVDGVLSSLLRFIRELGPAINVFVDNAIIAVTKLVNFIVSAIEYLVNTLIVKAVNKIIDSINSIAEYVNITIPRVREVSFQRFRPRLAKGGIINMPGRGVPVGGAIAGERGREAVIPLTDSQQMELLGESIGKYITISANIVNTMNGRVISRELQKVQNNSDFAYNR